MIRTRSVPNHPWVPARVAGGDTRAELAPIERAILRSTTEVLEEFDGLQAALRCSVTRSRHARSPATDRSIAAAPRNRCASLEPGSDERAMCHATTGV